MPNWYTRWLDRFSNTLSKEKKQFIEKELELAREEGRKDEQTKKDTSNRF